MDLLVGFLIGVCITSLFAMAFVTITHLCLTKAFEAGMSQAKQSADKDPADYWKPEGYNVDDAE